MDIISEGNMISGKSFLLLLELLLTQQCKTDMGSRAWKVEVVIKCNSCEHAFLQNLKQTVTFLPAEILQATRKLLSLIVLTVFPQEFSLFYLEPSCFQTTTCHLNCLSTWALL